MMHDQETGTMSHIRLAIIQMRQWARLQSHARKENAKKLSIQAAVSVLLGLFVLAWAEAALYLALHTKFAAHWSALLVLAINLTVIASVNLVLMRSRKKLDLDRIRAENRMSEAKLELRAAKYEMTNKIVIPFNRYKKPIAVAGTFAVGVLVARALNPRG